MTLQKLYESQTGEKALYRKGSSDYHTLRYVRWLEDRASQQATPPTSLIILQSIIHDATGDTDNPDKRLWPIRAENYRNARRIMKGGVG